MRSALEPRQLSGSEGTTQSGGMGVWGRHLHWRRDILGRMNLEDARPDSYYLRIWSREYSVDIDSFDDGMPLEAQIRCCTVGSLMKSKSGWGYIIKGEGMEIWACGSLGNEIVTITEAAKQLLLVKGKQISFSVDSQAALLALKAIEI